VNEAANLLFHKSHVGHKTQHHISPMNRRMNPEIHILRLDIQKNKVVEWFEIIGVYILQQSSCCQLNQGSLLMQSLHLVYHQRQHVVLQHCK
jgi:hypothetical protein